MKLPDLKTFETRYANMAELHEMQGVTVKLYRTPAFVWGFDRTEGHLVFQIARHTGEVRYQCETYALIDWILEEVLKSEGR